MKNKTKQKNQNREYTTSFKTKKNGLHYYCWAGTHIQMISKPTCTSVLLLINMQLFDTTKNRINQNKEGDKPELKQYDKNKLSNSRCITILTFLKYMPWNYEKVREGLASTVETLGAPLYETVEAKHFTQEKWWGLYFCETTAFKLLLQKPVYGVVHLCARTCTHAQTVGPSILNCTMWKHHELAPLNTALNDGSRSVAWSYFDI